MGKKTHRQAGIKNPNHQADIKNPNKGTTGTNMTWDQAQGNRGKQINPTWTPPAGAGAGQGGGAKK